MTTKASLTLRNSLFQFLPQEINGTCVLKLYTGTQPATPETTATGTLLATFSNNINFNPASGGGIGLNIVDYSLPTATAVAAGTAGWGRLTVVSPYSYALDGLAGTTGQQFNLSSTTIAIGDVITLQTCAITLPA